MNFLKNIIGIFQKQNQNQARRFTQNFTKQQYHAQRQYSKELNQDVVKQFKQRSEIHSVRFNEISNKLNNLKYENNQYIEQNNNQPEIYDSVKKVTFKKVQSEYRNEDYCQGLKELIMPNKEIENEESENKYQLQKYHVIQLREQIESEDIQCQINLKNNNNNLVPIQNQQGININPLNSEEIQSETIEYSEKPSFWSSLEIQNNYNTDIRMQQFDGLDVTESQNNTNSIYGESSNYQVSRKDIQKEDLEQLEQDQFDDEQSEYYNYEDDVSLFDDSQLEGMNNNNNFYMPRL